MLKKLEPDEHRPPHDTAVSVVVTSVEDAATTRRRSRRTQRRQQSNNELVSPLLDDDLSSEGEVCARGAHDVVLDTRVFLNE